MNFEWVPGTPLNADALARLKQNFPKPTEPPPEAWFMGDINYQTWIIEEDPNGFDHRRLERYLRITAGGFINFPKVEWAATRWRESFHYLLPYLIELSVHAYEKERYFLGEIVGYFMQIYPDNIPEVYSGFREDILVTLGSAFMAPQFWDGEDLSKVIIQADHEYWLLYATDDSVYVLSSTLLFYLKYLTHTEIKNWCVSLFKINGKHWHYNFLDWSYKMTFILSIFEDETNLDGSRSFQCGELVVGQTFRGEISLPTANMKAFIKMLKQHHIYYG